MAMMQYDQPVFKRKRTGSLKPGFYRQGGYFRFNNALLMAKRRHLRKYRRPQYSPKDVELKYKDGAFAQAPVAAAGNIVQNSLHLMAQGTTPSERIGNKIVIKQIFLHIEVLLPSTATVAETSDIVRILVVKDKQCNGAAATVAAVLQGTTLYDFNNMENKGRFKTLAERTYSLKSGGAGNSTATTIVTMEDIIHDTIAIKCNIPVQYGGAGGAITDIKSNNVFLLAISSGGFANFYGGWRVRYDDL